MGAIAPSLLILIPTRGRARRLRKLARRFKSTTPHHRLLFVVDPDDLHTQREAQRWGEMLLTEERLGYPAKVNLGIRESAEDYILVGADDIQPKRHWFQKALPYFTDGIGMVATNDLGNLHVLNGELATHPLVARWYVKDGLYHEGYYHNGADLDASKVAIARGAFAFAPDSVVEHLHPNYGKSRVDTTYRDGGFYQLGTDHDHDIYEKRKHLWGG